MKTIFYLAGGLLTLSGILHLVRLVMYYDPQRIIPAVLVGLFGVAYLVVGIGLLRKRDTAVRWGLILPAVGLVLTLIGLVPTPDFFTIAFIVIDLLVIVLIGYVMLAGRGLLRRVQ